MAAKRLRLESGSDPDQPPQPERRRTRNRPTLASVIGEVVVVNSLHHFCSALEPLLRRVVNEEVDQGLRRSTRSRYLTRSPSLRIQPPPPPTQVPSTLQLIFTNQPSLSIFTGTKILDPQTNPLHLLLVDAGALPHIVPASLPLPVKVHIVALDGDFARSGDFSCNSTTATSSAATWRCWTREEFDKNVVRERAGKRPLLAGDVCVTMRDGVAVAGDIEFTDNSSWVRSRKFRIGARVASPESAHGVRIREAFTEAFVVKDHRGELYRKHHPPMLEDEVWRLEKIGKDGVFHRKLSCAGINTVQDFLKLSVVDTTKLRKILGNGMSDKMWESTITHAKECVMGNKFYVFHGSGDVIVLNPICQVVEALINGQSYATRDLIRIDNGYIQKLAKAAYANWELLEETERLPNEATLLTQGTMRGENHHTMSNCFRQSGNEAGSSVDEVEVVGSHPYVGSNDWLTTYQCTSFARGDHHHNMPDLG